NFVFRAHDDDLLLLFPDAFEGRFVRRFHVHELTGFRVTLDPMSRRSLSLGTLAHCTVTMSITCRRVSSHIDYHSA
ncbi:TPA: hypothetical protein ACQQS2_006458, partial [Pseudomonas aeruginosa]